MNLLQFVCSFCALSFVVVTASIPTDGVIFPDYRRTKSNKEGCGLHCSQQNAIPISLAKQLGSIDSSEKFLRQFVENGRSVALAEGLLVSEISLRSPFAQSIDATKKVPVANCKPEQRTISLKDTNDPTLISYPMCVRLEQCGGCCNHDLLSCQPSKTSPVNVTIVMTKYVGNQNLKYMGKKTITLIKHETCSCDCKIKPTDCKGRQIYKKDECRCICEDEQEERECNNHSEKLWDPNSCQCLCRDLQECSSGLVFDNDSCTCVKTPEWRSYNSYY